MPAADFTRITSDLSSLSMLKSSQQAQGKSATGKSDDDKNTIQEGENARDKVLASVAPLPEHAQVKSLDSLEAVQAQIQTSRAQIMEQTQLALKAQANLSRDHLMAIQS